MKVMFTFLHWSLVVSVVLFAIWVTLQLGFHIATMVTTEPAPVVILECVDCPSAAMAGGE